MTVRVKICGLTDRSDLMGAITAGADAVGVIADVPVDTPRAVPVETAATLVAAVPPLTTSVLVTMADDAADALDLVDQVDPNVIQLHGGLPPTELAAVAKAIPTIAAYDIDAEDAIQAAGDHADAILLDSTDADGAGGTGRTHDWALARSYVERLDVPVILAGGLHPENVADAVRTVEPYAVDVASGVADPSNPARKDFDAVHRFIARARSSPEVNA